MDSYKLRVIKNIQSFIKKQNSSAYFELICTDVFGEFNDENQLNLSNILKELENENRIEINGDRISLRKSNLLIITETGKEDILLKNAGLEFKKIETDIGHGCQIPTFGLELVSGIFEFGVSALIVGTTISKIKASVDGWHWLTDKFKEVFNFNKLRVYYDENILISGAINEILKEYDCIDQIKLVTKTKVKLSADGYYSMKNYGFEESSLESSPYCLHYFVFELTSKDFQYDFDIVRIEMKSTGKIITYSKIKVSI